MASLTRRASQVDMATAAAPASESAFARLIAAPVLFVSFLVSLAFIDWETSSRVFGKDRKSKDDYYHANQKKLGKREMDDAFQIRSKVIMGFCLASGIGLAVFGFGVSRLWQLVWNSE